MRAPLTAARAALAALVLLLPPSLVAAEFKLPDADATPAELVNAALRSELEGPSDVRKTLLDRALELDPNYAPARWQSGFVRYEGEWLTLSEMFERASVDKRLAGYRQRRDALVDTADSHRELARWCKKNRLVDEARIHWAKVLEFDPQDAEALKGLELQLHDGMLLTKRQIADRRREAVERAEAMRRFKPQMEKLRHALKAGSAERDAALAELAKLRDPSALPALLAVFATPGKSDQDKFVDRTLVTTISRIHSPEATQALVAYAMGSSQSDLACTELKKRPLATYVPELIASMPLPSSWSASYNVMLLASGGVLLNTEWHERHGDQKYTLSRGVSFNSMTSYLFPRNPQNNFARIDFSATFRRADLAVREFQQQARQASQSLQQKAEQDDWQTQQINTVLANVTDSIEPRSREEWQSWWTDYAETYTPSYDPGRRYRSVSENYLLNDFRVTLLVSASCFPAGTKVLTGLGKCPIESLRPGDRVICKDAESGELVTRPIQATTLRPAAPLVKLTLGSKTLSATRGHPFWVNGQGWTMAKHLKVGQILHGIDGAVRIDAIEEAPAREAYNLVVGDCGTYFVGELPVLVHDNTPLTETTAVVPGLELAATP